MSSQMHPFLLPLILFSTFLLAFTCSAKGGGFMRLGINYGTLGDDLPSATRSVALIQSLGAGAVKIYDANPTILRALAGTRLRVSIMVPNDQIAGMGTKESAADAWVAANVVPFYRTVRIRYILVGNEILSDGSLANSTWPALVPAMYNIHRALVARGLRSIKVGTPLAMDVMTSAATFRPPSAGTFRRDVAETVIRPMLRFLSKANSFFFVDVYPYLTWAGNPSAIPLDYALFEAGAGAKYVDPGNGLTYTNLLDEILDSVAAAMGRMGYGHVRLALAETGWPNAGDLDQIGASVHNAAVYNRNLARRLSARPAIGAPARPGVELPVFLFSLYNEDRKPGPGTERHWGLLYPNGTGIYEVDLTGRRPTKKYPPLPPPVNDKPYKGGIWCVWNGKGNASEVGAAVTYACGQGSSTCEAMRSRGPCFRPNTMGAHANYAFNSYWQQFRRSGGTCYFGGLAVQTAKDPKQYGGGSKMHLVNIMFDPFIFMAGLFNAGYGHCKYATLTK